MDTPRPRHRCRRALAALGVGVGVLGAALVWLQTPRGCLWTANRAQVAVQGLLADGWVFDVPTVAWTFDGQVTLGGVRFRDPSGATAIGVNRLDLKLDLRSLLHSTVHVTSARADGVIVAMQTDADGVMNLSRAFGGPSPVDPNTAPWGGLPFTLVVDDLGLRDAMVSSWGVPAPDANPPGFAAKVLSLRGGVTLPRRSRAVTVKGLDLAGVLLRPGPSGLSLKGDVSWTGDGLTLAGVAAQLQGAQIGVEGHVHDLSGDGDVDATVTLSPIDFRALDVLFHAPLQGTYEGRLHAGGTLAALTLDGTLGGTNGTRGGLTFGPGSMVCLPGRGLDAEDACAGPIRPGDPAPEKVPVVTPDTPLRWKANLLIDSFQVEDLVPSAKGPLRLEGALVARGGGTSWPDGLWVDEGRWDGEELDAYGVRVRSLHARLGLHHGVLEMDGLNLSGVAGSVLGQGTLDFKDGNLALQLHGPLDPAMLSDFGVTDLGGTGSYNATLTGGIYTTGVPIDIHGTLDMSPVTWAKDGVVVQRAHGEFHARVFNGITDVDATIAGDGVAAYGTTTDHADVADLHVHVDGDVVTVDGKMNAPAVRYANYLDLNSAVGEFHVRVPFVGSRTVDVNVFGSDGHLLGVPTDDAIALFHMVDDIAVVDTTLHSGGQALLELPDLRIDTTAMVVSFDRLFFHPTWRQTWTNDAPVTFRLVDGGVADAAISLSSELGAIHVKGAVGTRGPLNGVVSVGQLQLSALSELFPDALPGLDGMLTADVTMRGDAARPTIHARIDADDIFDEGLVRWLGVHGDVDVVSDVATLALDADVAGAPWLKLKGTLPVRSDLSAPGVAQTGPIDLGLRVEPGDLKRFTNALPGLPSVPAGDASGVLRVRGDIHDPDLDAQGVVEAAVAGLQHRGRAEFDLHRQAGLLDAQVDLFDGYDTLVEADGTAKTRLGEVMDWLLAGAPKPDFTDLSLFASDLDVSSWLDHIPVQTVRALAGVDLDISGDLDGHVGVRGSPRTPTLDVNVDAQLFAGGTPADVHVGLAPAALGYDLDFTMGEGSAQWVTAAGRVPIAVDLTKPWGEWGASTFDLAFGGSGVPLDVARAVVPELEVQRGVLLIDGRMGGTLADPRPDVRATVDGAALRYRPFGIDVKDLAVAVSVGPDRAGTGAGAVLVTLESLHADTRPTSTSLDRIAQLGASRVEASGALSLKGWKPDGVRARVDLNNAWLVATDTSGLRATGQITTDGTWPDLLVDGKLSVDQGRFEINTAELWSSADLQLDPSIAVHRVAGVSRSTGDAGPHWYDGIHGRVALDLGRNTNAAIRVPVLDDLGSLGASVTRADIDARMGGQLEIGAKGMDLSIQGDLELLEGRVKVLASRFDLVDGSHISFFGSNYVDPQLDIAGAMVVGGGEVRLHLTGTPSDPTFVLSSDSFGSDAELFTILLTGQAPEELSSQQGKAALQAVGDLLLNNVLGGVNLGSVSVEADGTVRVGLPVYRTVYVETTVTPAPKLDQNHVTVLAEWSIMPRLVLAAAYGDRKVWGNLFWEVRFDGPRRDREERKQKRQPGRHSTPEDPTQEVPTPATAPVSVVVVPKEEPAPPEAVEPAVVPAPEPVPEPVPTPVPEKPEGQ